jgi:hypothetical protein
LAIRSKSPEHVPSSLPAEADSDSAPPSRWIIHRHRPVGDDATGCGWTFLTPQNGMCSRAGLSPVRQCRHQVSQNRPKHTAIAHVNSMTRRPRPLRQPGGESSTPNAAVPFSSGNLPHQPAGRHLQRAAQPRKPSRGRVVSAAYRTACLSDISRPSLPNNLKLSAGVFRRPALASRPKSSNKDASINGI